ncbi:WhiB family transcriptional regulator [Streptomyces sp. SBC-4]|nr:WhiB family transcriptional regulator [Streptomyces sp. SBC-4]MDV5145453.1 WhiB family transcriptional regulator [Streptomyces sp. SBC-4]
MNIEIRRLADAGVAGNWRPLLEAAKNVSSSNWADDARCAGQELEIFFPDSEHPWSDPDQVREANGIALNRPLNFCADCPFAVQARCLVESLRHDDQYGIRAGMLASEREHLLAAWDKHIDPEAVSSVLRGVPTVLNAAERRAVIARVAENAAPSVEHARRGLGIDRKYLWQLVREHKKSAAA